MQSFREFLNESTSHVEHEILSMYNDPGRYQIRQISELTGVSIAGIYRILEKHGVDPARRKINNHHAVHQFHNSGIPAHKISELTGYSKRQVYNILSKPLFESNR